MTSSCVKVAFFDSGIGGLTTLSACVEYAKNNLPGWANLHFFYYGDNFRAPYGNLSRDTILSYVSDAFELFERLGVDGAVIACNTATAVGADFLRKKYSFPIIGIEPAIISACKNLQNQTGEIFALMTRATFLSERFNCLCARARENFPCVKIRAFACEELAGVIEKNISVQDFDYTKFLPLGAPSAVVLGCTHYVYIKNQIERFYSCSAFDGNEGVARRLFSLLYENGKIPEEISVKNVDNSNLPFRGKVFPDAVDKRLEVGTGKGMTVGGKNGQKLETIDAFFENQEKNRFLRPLVTPTPKTPNFPKITFLGEAKMVNKTKYEQMFAIK